MKISFFTSLTISSIAFASNSIFYPLDDGKIILDCEGALSYTSYADLYELFRCVDFSSNWSYYSGDPFCRIFWNIHGHQLVKELDIVKIIKGM